MKTPMQLLCKRMIIRRFVDSDFEAFSDFLSNSAATRFLNFSPEQKTPEGARAFFDSVIESYETFHPIFSLAIVKKEHSAYMGSCGLSALEDGTGVECYYVLSPDYWGRGYAVEALTALFEYAFSELRIDKITARIHLENLPSQKVAESMGMTKQGEVYDSFASTEMSLFLISKSGFRGRSIEGSSRQ